jgi:hypothetical protein
MAEFQFPDEKYSRKFGEQDKNDFLDIYKKYILKNRPNLNVDEFSQFMKFNYFDYYLKLHVFFPEKNFINIMEILGFKINRDRTIKPCIFVDIVIMRAMLPALWVCYIKLNRYNYRNINGFIYYLDTIQFENTSKSVYTKMIETYGKKIGNIIILRNLGFRQKPFEKIVKKLYSS